MKRDEVVRRLKAAQALGGFDSVPALAEATDIGLKRLRGLFQGKQDARAIELRHIAETCRLPYEFFLADFALIGRAVPGEPDRNLWPQTAAEMDEQARAAEAVFDRVAESMGFESFRDLVGASRRTKQSLVDQLPAVDPETEAAEKTRGEGDASPADTPTPAEATPRTGGSTAG